MDSRTSDWRGELGRWLKPFLDRLGHKARRQMCPLYVSGLIGPGERKSVQPMAERVALGDYDQLHHFIAAGVWETGPVETELLVQADKLVGGSDAVLVIDDTAMPKKGTHSVGVAAQYASALGKTASCQTLVSLTLARGEVPVVLALRLFLPESWTSNRARLDRAGVPAEYRTARTKPELALVEIDRAIAAGVRFGCVLADAGYGLSAPFRQGLTARKLAWAVGIPRHLKVYPADVRMIWPVAKRGRPRQRHVPDILSNEMPSCAKSIVRRTLPAVLISETPPGLLDPANAGIETKNVPVFGFHAGCSMPPAAIPPWPMGTVMGLTVRATGARPFVVEKRFPYAGVSALLAART